MTVTTSARATVDAYLQTVIARGPFEQYLTEDVTIDLIGTEIGARGRDDVGSVIRAAHFQMFDSAVEIVAVIVDEGGRKGAVEAIFAARHIGEFAGIPATGREVRVPYSVHYDLTDEGISALRVYALGQGLVSALTA